MPWNRAGDIAGRLRGLREALGWTQEQMGDAAGVKAQQVSDWERGRTPPGRRPLERLAKALRITVAGFEKGGPMPATLLQRPAAPLTPAVGDRAVVSDTATAEWHGLAPTVLARSRVFQVLEGEILKLLGLLRELEATSAGADADAQVAKAQSRVRHAKASRPPQPAEARPRKTGGG